MFNLYRKNGIETYEKSVVVMTNKGKVSFLTGRLHDCQEMANTKQS